MEAQKELFKPRNAVQICTAWSTNLFTSLQKVPLENLQVVTDCNRDQRRD